MEGEQDAGGVVGIWHGAGEIGPTPTAWGSAGEWMAGGVLLGQQPPPDGGFHPGGKAWCSARFGESADGLGGDPRGEVGVDGPTAVGALGSEQEGDAAADDIVVTEAGGGEAHGDEAGQRCGFLIAAVGWLHGLGNLQQARGQVVAQEAERKQTGWGVLVADETDSDQGRETVADDAHIKAAEPAVGAGGEFEWQLWYE